MEKIVFIDSNHLLKMMKPMGKVIDYEVFRQALLDLYDGPVRIYYYVCTTIHNKALVPPKTLIDWLSYNGYIIRHFYISDHEFEVERRAVTATALALDVIGKKDATMLFCVSGVEYFDLIKQASQNNYVQILNSKDVPASQNLRQIVDLTIDIKDFNEDAKDPFLVNYDELKKNINELKEAS